MLKIGSVWSLVWLPLLSVYSVCNKTLALIVMRNEHFCQTVFELLGTGETPAPYSHIFIVVMNIFFSSIPVLIFSSAQVFNIFYHIYAYFVHIAL